MVHRRTDSRARWGAALVTAAIACDDHPSPPPHDDGWQQHWTRASIGHWIAACGDASEASERQLGQQVSVQASTTVATGSSPGHRVCTAVWDEDAQTVTSVRISIVDLTGDPSAPRDMTPWIDRLDAIAPAGLRSALDEARGGGFVQRAAGGFRATVGFFAGNPLDWTAHVEATGRPTP